MIFPGGLTSAARSIRVLMENDAYPFDCRDLLTEDEPDLALKQRDDFAHGYMTFKHTVAHVLAPRKIAEIGIGSGIAALAFFAACPNAAYFGIDNSAMTSPSGLPLVDRAIYLFTERNYDAHILPADSQTLDAIPSPTYDLIHVDGSHLREHARHDVELAHRALAPGGFILVDDARDTAVAAGTFDAISALRPGSVDWAYFEDTWTGSILIHQEKSRP